MSGPDYTDRMIGASKVLRAGVPSVIVCNGRTYTRGTWHVLCGCGKREVIRTTSELTAAIRLRARILCPDCVAGARRGRGRRHFATVRQREAARRSA